MGPSEILSMLKEEVVQAMGCTEPVAIALTAAHAFNLVQGKVEKIKLNVSCNIYKNAKAVGIPGTVHTGVEMAAALGVSISEPIYDLNILSSLTKADLERALQLQEQAPVEVEVLYDSPKVYIDVEVSSDQGVSRAVASGRHTNLVLLQRGSEIILDKRDKEKADKEKIALTNYTLQELIENVLSIPTFSLEFLQEGIELNMAMAEAGLEMKGGMGIGSSWKRLTEKGLLGTDLNNEVSCYTAAACDARMDGVQLPVMSSAGSGNHGLVTIIPIARAAERLKASREKVLQALAISHLVNIYIKEHTGRLSPICGCSVAAGAGASAGLAYLLGGEMEDIDRAIVNIISSLAGMICDGGKVGCALKLSASASMAWQGALLAREGIKVPAGNGIVAATIEETLRNLGKVSQEGMSQVDRSVILAMDNQCC